MKNVFPVKAWICLQGVDELIDMLQRFKAAPAGHEQDVYRCMIHNLFDEYRFFPKYPEKELQVCNVFVWALLGRFNK